jgi:hypothetical protein
MSDFEGWLAIKSCIEEAARVDPNPNIGRLFPKSHKHLTRYS